MKGGTPDLSSEGGHSSRSLRQLGAVQIRGAHEPVPDGAGSIVSMWGVYRVNVGPVLGHSVKVLGMELK